MRATSMIPVLTIPVLTILLLAGCVPTSPEPTATPSPEASTSAPSSTPTPTPTADDSTPVTIACDSLISPEAMYDYNPNFVLETGIAPPAGSLAAEAVEAQGVFCRWINTSSGETIDVSVASPSPAALTARANELVGSSNPVPTYEVEGYFEIDGGVGIAQAINAPYWVAMVSPVFLEPGDAAPLMIAAVTALG